MKIFSTLDFLIEKSISAILVVFIVSILFLSCSSIVLRWFQYSQLWIDPLVRHLVFFSTFLGGVLATGKGTHIGIDLIGTYLEHHKLSVAAQIIKIIVCTVSVATLVWLVVASINFSQIELQYGKAVFWGIESGYLVSFIPIGFGLIGYRFFYILLVTVQELVGSKR